MHNLISTCIRSVIAKRKLLFWVGIVLFLASLAGLVRLNVDNNYRNYIGADNASLQMSDWLSERQGTSDEVFVLIYKPSHNSIFDPLSLAQYTHLTVSAKNLPHVRSTEDLLTQEKLVRVRLDQSDPKYRAANVLLGQDLFSEEGLAGFKSLIASSPTIQSRFVGSDGKTAAILLFTDLSATDQSRQEKIGELLEAVTELQTSIREMAPHDSVFLSGTPLFEHAAFDVLRKDLRKIFPAAILLICGVLFLVYRSMLFVPLALIVIFVPVVVTAGLLAGIGIEFSNLSISALLLVGTLAVADVMHVSNTYFRQRSAAVEIEPALNMALQGNLGAIAATTLTTMIGQTALLISAAEPIRVMGLVVAVGSGAALFFALLMLPYVLSLATAKSGAAAANKLAPILAQLASKRAAHPGRTLAAFAVLASIATWGLTNSTLSDSLKGWFAEDTDFNRTMSILDGAYLGPDTITVAIEALPEDLLAARQLPEMSEEMTFYEGLANALHSAPIDGYWLDPATTLAASRSLIEAEATVLSQTNVPETALEPFTTETAARSGLLTRYQPGKRDYSLWYFDGDSASSFVTVSNAQVTNETLTQSLQHREYRVGGIGLALAELSVHNFWSVLEGSLFSFLLICVAMLFTFRSWALGLLSILPNVTPVLFALGIWGVWKGEINLAAITVFSVSLGIVVDDTIHIVLKYKEKLELTGDRHQALHKAISECGVGILTTTVVLATGFCLLGTSGFLLTAQKSLLVGWAIIFAFLFDVLVLPALLVIFTKSHVKIVEPQLA